MSATGLAGIDGNLTKNIDVAEAGILINFTVNLEINFYIVENVIFSE